VELDFTRNESSVSKNALTLKKSKSAGKGFAGLGRIVLTIPEGDQKYALACDAPSDIAMSFRFSKEAVKSNLAAAEVAVPSAKPREGAKTANAPASAEAPATPTNDGSSGAYVGLLHPTTF
jgi:hypothetical protein